MRNYIKKLNSENKIAKGCTLVYPSPDVVEMLGMAGFDYIISYGYMLQNGIKVQEMLEKINIKTGLINFHCLKPIDKKGLITLSKKSKLLIIVEDHNQFGGLGSQISQILSKKNPTKIISINSNDKFGTTGLPDENLDYLGLSVKKIFEKIKNYVKKK